MSYLVSIYIPRIIRVSLLLLSAAGAYTAKAQNLKCRTFPPGVKLRLDTLPVEASSIRLSPSLVYIFDAEHNTLVLDEDPADSVTVCFRTLSKDLLNPVYTRDIKTYAYHGGAPARRAVAAPFAGGEEEELFSLGPSVDSYGAITRGISFGNRQNVFVQSALNLQMEGQLTEELKVSAVITDQNIPYQPEGNTRQIRDFDNVFIKLYNDELELIAGDIVLQNPVEESFFLRYNKNVQGISAKYRYTLKNGWKASSVVTGSAAKGQFASVRLDPVEGMQGPYRLRGPDGEKFIIILANSERVFVDGQLLQRGFDRDYVIDYNLGEITFSSNILITRFSRIRVDFEYAGQYYSRSNITATQQVSNDRFRFYFNYYREKDNPNATLGFDLTEEDLVQLRASGDVTGGARISGSDSVGFIENSILYEKLDTLITGTLYEFYAYSNDPGSAHYKLSFTDVGQGNGNYVLKNTTSNGRVFEWVAPEDGVSRGSYAAVLVVPAPNKKQMMVFGSVIKLSPYEETFQEVALSDRDRNLYSPADDHDNRSVAWRGGLISKNRPTGLPGYTFSGLLTFEFDQKHFSPVDRFRKVEFDRNWSYNSLDDTTQRADRLLHFTAGIKKDPKNEAVYQLNYRERTAAINGIQQKITIKKELGPLRIRSDNFYLHNNPGKLTSEWFRTTQDVQWSTGILNPGYAFVLDRNTTRYNEADSITGTLMHFHSHNFHVQTPDTSRTRFRLDYIRRFDQLPVEGKLQEYTRADEVRAGVETLLAGTQRINARLNYRKVKDFRLKETSENILGKVDWSGTFLDRNIRQTMSYSTANTRELKREFVFISVPAGEGTHTWRDENGDQVQDLNEFYEAINPDEMNYIKLFIPTDEYIEAFQTTLLHSVDAGFPSVWAARGAVLKTLSKLSVNTSFRRNYKTTDRSLSGRLNPFGVDLDEEAYIFARNLERYTLFYNRNGPGLAFDIGYSDQAGKSLLSNGYELKETTGWLSNLRFSLNSIYTIRLKADAGITRNISDYLQSRNFTLQRSGWSPEVVWQPLNTFRLIAGWERRSKENTDGKEEYSTINEYSLEATWLQAGKGSLNATFNWLDIAFSGERNTFVAYELLEALQPGINQRWQVNWQQSLGKGLQLNLQYNGRKSSGYAAVHTGSVQLTAYF